MNYRLTSFAASSNLSTPLFLRNSALLSVKMYSFSCTHECTSDPCNSTRQASVRRQEVFSPLAFPPRLSQASRCGGTGAALVLCCCQSSWSCTFPVQTLPDNAALYLLILTSLSKDSRDKRSADAKLLRQKYIIAESSVMSAETASALECSLCLIAKEARSGSADGKDI